MSNDIDAALKEWEYQPGSVQARLIEAPDRQVLQMRVELGVLQLEVKDRPDGSQPNGFRTYFDHLRNEAGTGESFVLSEDQCLEADREFVQFYHRRICWLTLRQYGLALKDADHTLAFMDFVRDHSPNEEYTQAHEQYRGFVLFQRTQADAARALESNDPEAAVDAIRSGLERMREFFVAFEAEEQMEEDSMVQHLRRMESVLRQQHHIEATLQEQLDLAVANEEYEKAAEIRDALRRRR